MAGPRRRRQRWPSPPAGPVDAVERPAVDSAATATASTVADPNPAFRQLEETFDADLPAYAVGGVLEPADRVILNGWLKANTTGDELIRAGVPDGWVVGDNSVAGGYGTRNDVAVIWPPGRAPIVLAVLSSRDQKDADYDNALIARATETAIAAL